MNRYPIEIVTVQKPSLSTLAPSATQGYAYFIPANEKRGNENHIKIERRVKIALESYRHLVYNFDCMMYLFQFRSGLKGTQACVNHDAREVT